MVIPKLPKLEPWVRFPSPAPLPWLDHGFEIDVWWCTANGEIERGYWICAKSNRLRGAVLEVIALGEQRAIAAQVTFVQDGASIRCRARVRAQPSVVPKPA